ncbi:phosphoglycerate mutase family protein [Acinetobacter qingfengensis]|uniref:Histidine phosphatase family protein n=1 Tax=Acinetobacter qingfengensis TaxID=1262585 RepID=A0A1E7RE77_9GAMM|nr:phosphoglycerate mutase family protein [Acinetobacter qingfengensis]KAA8734565.1 phosphoglycerate mutase family protein [Acinetobacter qingfengensis]OEY97641.1 histidine phosphatase family protein [Acinetobacter qingfengensis]
MLQAIELLPVQATPVLLFTRHSLREVVRGIGLAGYDLQLTDQGRELAFAWGEHLTQQTSRNITNCISSPIQRCVDTAELMIMGADQIKQNNTHKIDIAQESLLVEPGSFVVDIKQAAPYFREQGAVGFINSFVQNCLPGMKHPVTGVLDVLKLLYQTYQVEQQHLDHCGHLSLAVSHDTILAAFIAIIAGHQQVESKDWPEMMEGIFVWFEYVDAPFEQNIVHWIWRGQHQRLDIARLIKHIDKK